MPLFTSSYSPTNTITYKFFNIRQVKQRRTPLTTFYHDLVNVSLNSPLIVNVLAAFSTDRAIDELYLRDSGALSLVWFTTWSFIQLVFFFPLMFLFTAVTGLFVAFIRIQDRLIWSWMQGPQIQVWPPDLPRGYNPRHRWIYVNGIATGKVITRQNLQNLSQLFHNPVLAVNNRTYGFLGDILECVVQRSFGYRTNETNITSEIIKDFLNDPDIDKVIFIAHSQGGIIASQILDDLYCDTSASELGKLEVYTFGSAALTFRNPYRDNSHTTRVVPVMEHYCNEYDMVTRWGALASADRSDLPFEGKVFVFEGQTGHMLNQHYLKYMFTGPTATWQSDNFQLRAVRRDKSSDKYYVTAATAKGSRDRSVQSLSRLWRYLDFSEKN